ncbi:hypothetical protein D3C85_1647310 [compost metagenome]
MAEHGGDKAVAQENIAEQQADHRQLNRTRADGIDRVQRMSKRPDQGGDQRSQEGAVDDFLDHPDAEQAVYGFLGQPGKPGDDGQQPGISHIVR